ncbi:hypothetical protein ILYODFUR_015117, partial [Ilyodon furcidens]
QTPPSLTVVPAAVTAFSREDIILTCEASGNPTPHIRWVKDGAQFGREQKGSGKVNASEYGKEAPLESFSGIYQCFASNDLGTAMTQTVEVIVEPHPFIPKENELTKTAFVGQSIILTCNPPKRSTPPRIYWMGTGMVHIPQNERVMIGLDGNLYFSNLVMDDSREDYNCYAQYTSARTIIHPTAVRLTVQSSNDVSQEKGPHFLQPQGSHTAVQALRGQTVTLECIPKGLPTPKVEWQKTDGDLKTTSASINNSARWLHFKSITEDDDGEYKCRAHNIHGNATRSFTITVKAAPYWTKQSPDLKYAPGETVRLDCLAKGNPDPTITWRINGEPLTAVDEDSRRTVTSSALILRDVVLSDTAVYQCEATNVHGSILQNINLFVVGMDTLCSHHSVAYTCHIKILCHNDTVFIPDQGYMDDSCLVPQSFLLRSCLLMGWCTRSLKMKTSTWTVNLLVLLDHIYHGSVTTWFLCCQILVFPCLPMEQLR